MTDHDNLRDRIAEAIAGEEEHPHPRGYAAHAQAIIDEFGLTVETPRCDWENKTHSMNCDCWCEPDAVYSRVVGKWEKQ